MLLRQRIENQMRLPGAYKEPTNDKIVYQGDSSLSEKAYSLVELTNLDRYTYESDIKRRVSDENFKLNGLQRCREPPRCFLLDYYSRCLSTSTALVPPNANEWDNIIRAATPSRAWFET